MEEKSLTKVGEVAEAVVLEEAEGVTLLLSRRILIILKKSPVRNLLGLRTVESAKEGGLEERVVVRKEAPFFTEITLMQEVVVVELELEELFLLLTTHT